MTTSIYSWVRGCAIWKSLYIPTLPFGRFRTLFGRFHAFSMTSHHDAQTCNIWTGIRTTCRPSPIPISDTECPKSCPKSFVAMINWRACILGSLTWHPEASNTSSPRLRYNFCSGKLTKQTFTLPSPKTMTRGRLFPFYIIGQRRWSLSCRSSNEHNHH